jgi:TetR/AcrR family transcriptional regulator, cholesterol catabolism regulator
VGKVEDNKRAKSERILAAARDLFRSRGYEGTTMEAIAERAGVAKGSVFFHARSKAALLNQVFQVDMERWVREAFGQPAQPGLLDDLVAKYASLQIAMCAQPDLARVYMREVAFASDDFERVQETMAVLLGETQRAIADKGGEELSDAVDVSALAFNLFSSYFMAQLIWLGRPDHTGDDPRDVLRPLFAVQLAAIGQPAVR